MGDRDKDLGTPSRVDAYFSSFDSQLVGMTASGERNGFLRCKSLVKEAIRVFTEGQNEPPRSTERIQRVDSEGFTVPRDDLAGGRRARACGYQDRRRHSYGSPGPDSLGWQRQCRPYRGRCSLQRRLSQGESTVSLIVSSLKE